jgi:hypothetical protein
VKGRYLVRLRDLLPGAALSAGMDERAVDASRIFRRWRDVVGRHIADHATPSSLRRGVLRVRADSPVWASEIGYLGEEICARVNEAAGCDLVREVRVWTGPAPTGVLPDPGERDRPAPGGGPGSAPADDPVEGLERARAAWARRRSGPGKTDESPGRW